jgi:hypothetical protein
MLALLLALSADCTGLVPPSLPRAVDLSPTSSCSVISLDGAGDVAISATGSSGSPLFASDGTKLGISVVPPWTPRSSGWYSLDTVPPAGASWKARVTSIDARGNVLGEIEFTDAVLRLFVLPNDDALVLTESSTAAAWQVRVTELSAAAAIVSGPTLVAAAGEPPRHGEFEAFAARDGAFLLFLQGWILPPFRNNQRIARWFDASGTPLTAWFVALDQALEGTARVALPDGGIVVAGRGDRIVAVQSRVAAAEPAPSWLTLNFVWQQIFVLRDRIATVDQSFDTCEQVITIRAPAGNVCGEVRVPVERDPFRQCPYAPKQIGQDGTLVQERVGGSYCHLRWWPRLLR